MGIGTDGVVYLIETSTGGVRWGFKGHVGNVWSVAYSPDGQMVASVGFDSAPLVWDVTGRILGASQQAAPLNAKELDAAWSDLAGEDAAKGWLAIRALLARPQQAVPFLKQRLPANGPLDPKRLARLLADLQDDEFDVREQACKDLAAVGLAAAPALRKLQASPPTADVRIRVEKLIGKLGQGGIVTEELRCGRAVEVLGYLATPEAQKLLEAEAQGDARSVLTHDARAALDRLARRQP
jgi:hypothetical protein